MKMKEKLILAVHGPTWGAKPGENVRLAPAWRALNRIGIGVWRARKG